MYTQYNRPPGEPLQDQIARNTEAINGIIALLSRIAPDIGEAGSYYKELEDIQERLYGLGER